MEFLSAYIKNRRQKKRQQQKLLLVKFSEETIKIILVKADEIVKEEVISWPEMATLDNTILEVLNFKFSKILANMGAELNLATIFFLDSESLYAETFTLPLLKKSELQKTLNWELKQRLYPEKYVMSMEVLPPKQQMQEVMVVAVKIGVYQLLQNLSVASKLHLEGILPLRQWETAKENWYQGKKFPLFILGGTNIWQIEKVRLYSKKILILCLVISCLLYGSGFIGLWWAKQQLKLKEGQLRELSYCQHTYAECQQLEEHISKLQATLQKLPAPPKNLVADIQIISQSLGTACWLESLAYDEKQNNWLVQGRTFHLSQIQLFIDRLEKSKHFTKIKLENIAQQDTAIFTVRLSAKEQHNEK